MDKRVAIAVLLSIALMSCGDSAQDASELNETRKAASVQEQAKTLQTSEQYPWMQTKVIGGEASQLEGDRSSIPSISGDCLAIDYVYASSDVIDEVTEVAENDYVKGVLQAESGHYYVAGHHSSTTGFLALATNAVDLSESKLIIYSREGNRGYHTKQEFQREWPNELVSCVLYDGCDVYVALYTVAGELTVELLCDSDSDAVPDTFGDFVPSGQTVLNGRSIPNVVKSMRRVESSDEIVLAESEPDSACFLVDTDNDGVADTATQDSVNRPVFVE